MRKSSRDGGTRPERRDVAWPSVTGPCREIERLLAEVRAHGEREQTPAETLRRVLLALDEVISNVARHGGGDATTMTLDIVARPQALVVKVFDDGVAFDPTAPVHLRQRPDPTTPGGLGLKLISELTTRETYRRSGRRNCLTLWFPWIDA